MPGTGLVACLAIVAAQRVGELFLSARNARRLLARGARESCSQHLPYLVVLHVAFPLALAADVVPGGARPGALAPLWLGVWLAAQALRYASILALGERWSMRVLVLPGVPLVRSGPYRRLRHPNYLAVAIEFAAGPLVFGAWRTALAFSVVHLLVQGPRLRCEEKALAASGGSASSGSGPGAQLSP